MALNTGSISKLLRPGINSVAGLAYDMYPAEWSEIFDSAEPSEMNYEEDIIMYGMGLAPIKQQQAPLASDTMQQASYIRYTHITYGIGYSITREAVEDNLYPKQAMEIAQNIAFACKQTEETVCANVLNRANNSAYVGWDGVSLLSSSHLLAKGGTANNQLAVAADLSESSLEQSLIDIANFVNDAGQRIALMGQKLIIPAALMFEADRILKSPDRYNTAERSINAMYNMGVLPQGYKVNHYLSSPSAWFIKTNAMKGLRRFDRRPLEVDNDTPEFWTENMSFKGTFRMSVGWTDWRGIYGSFGP